MDVPSTYLVDWLSWIKEYFKLRMFWNLMKETTGVLQAILLKQDTARLPASQWKQVCVNHSQFWNCSNCSRVNIISIVNESIHHGKLMSIYFFHKYTCTIDNGHWQPISGEVSWKKKAHERKRKTKLIALQKLFISIVYFVKGLNPGVISKGWVRLSGWT